MPELPEVETLRRELSKVIKNKKIKSAEILWAKTVNPLSEHEFQKKIKGQKIEKVERQAKILIVNFTGHLSLAFHLKMTGQLIFKHDKKMIVGGHPAPEDEKILPNNHTRLILTFSDNSKLYFNDMRKFGWVRLVDDEEVKLLIGHIGPDPLSKKFSIQYLIDLFKKYPKWTVKQILMDQTLIAGIGNIYADEAAFLSKLMPNRKARTIKPAEIKKLHDSIIKVLKLSIQKKGTSSRNYRRTNGKPGGFAPFLNVYGRAGEPCKICGIILKKMRHNGRGTVYCPKCQR
ncbi:MAG: bifunctional DNA-formamidopyrimidine glycosylase/DNA-(apurinic or apyrimidinic site) lyase [Patescibacteria group bacterium]